MMAFPIINASVMVDNVGTDKQRADLLEQIHVLKNNKAMDNSNDGCWRGQYELSNTDWLLAEIDVMLNKTVSYYIDIDKAYSQRFRATNHTVDHWINVNNPGSCNRIHSHKEYDYVALYYIQAEGTGDLTFHNPANLLHDCSLNSPWVSRMGYPPRDGDLLLWPAWIPHEVETNCSNKDRVNIAFNIKL